LRRNALPQDAQTVVRTIGLERGSSRTSQVTRCDMKKSGVVIPSLLLVVERITKRDNRMNFIG
jgi:hypothetical protein